MGNGFRLIQTALLMFSMSSNAGTIFNITDSGDAAAVQVKFCLNATAETSCEIHTLEHKDFTVLTNVPNKTYTDAGFKPISPGYHSVSANNCEVLSNGFCKFTADNSNPKSFVLGKPVIITPSGIFVMPDGTKIYSNTRVLGSLLSGRAKIKLMAEGGPAGENLGLEVNIFKNSAPSKSITFELSNPDLSGGSFNFTNLIVDYAKAGPGTYTIQIKAKNKPGQPIIATVQIIINIPTPPGPTPTPIDEVRASYLDTSALGSLAQISDVGIQASNLILFGFSNPQESSPSYTSLSTVQSIIERESTTGTTLNFLSLGGAYGSPSAFPIDPATAVANISSQINSYNSQISSSNKISGVDLDLEGGFTSSYINDLAAGFQQKGLYVSIAPQVYISSGSNIDPTAPTNLTLSSAGSDNAFALAVQNGYVDYILLQTYNTGGFTVGSVGENSVQFFTNVSQAMNNLVQNNCSGGRPGYQVCIPNDTEIVIGEPSNASGAGNANSIFGVAAGSNYDQTAVLNQLKSEWQTVKTTYANIAGIFQWSLNNDYDPRDYGDPYAVPGNFSKLIFNAGGSPTPPGPTPPGPTPGPTPTPTPTGSQFIMNVVNSSSSNAPTSVTLVVNGQYYVFGGYSTVLSPNQSALWGNLVAANANAAIRDSWALDALFSNGNTSFTTSKILLNSYSSSSDTVATPALSQVICANAAKFELGHSYQLTLNNVSSTCVAEQVA